MALTTTFDGRCRTCWHLKLAPARGRTVQGRCRSLSYRERIPAPPPPCREDPLKDLGTSAPAPAPEKAVKFADKAKGNQHTGKVPVGNTTKSSRLDVCTDAANPIEGCATGLPRRGEGGQKQCRGFSLLRVCVEQYARIRKTKTNRKTPHFTRGREFFPASGCRLLTDNNQRRRVRGFPRKLLDLAAKGLP